MHALLCPKCLSPRVHRSRRRGLKHYLAILLLRRPFRCHNCEHRFFDFVFVKRVKTAQ